MNEQIKRITALLARLSPREQRLVAVFAALLGVVVIYSAIVEPLINGRERIEAEIATLAGDLGTMAELANRIRVAESVAGKKSPAKELPKDFSLFSFIDKVTAGAVRPESVSSMNPSRRELDDGSTESTVELKLSQVSLSEAVAVLRGIEDAGHPVYVKRLDLKKRYDNANRFDLVLVAAALSRT